jgi:hypothetical protein
MFSRFVLRSAGRGALQHHAQMGENLAELVVKRHGGDPFCSVNGEIDRIMMDERAS